MLPEGQKTSVKASSLTRVSRNYYIRKKKLIPHVTAKLTKEKVVAFLMDPSNSTCLPGKNDLVKVGKGKGNKKRIYILNDKLYNIYVKFTTIHETKISFSSFCRCRPKNIKLVDYRKLATCLCHRHQNMQLKLEPLGSIGLNKKISDVMKMYTDEELKWKLDELKLSEVKFEVWRAEKSLTKNLQSKTEWKLKTETLNKNNFIDEFLEGMQELRIHSFRVTSIFENIKELTTNLPKDEVICHMDFSRNFECVPLDEIQEGFFNRKMVTLHPMVLFYRNKENKIEQQSYTAVSDSKDHTAVEVIAFCKKLLAQDNPNLPAIVKKVHYISDSPQKQYRNCTMTSFIKNHFEITGVEATQTFLEVMIMNIPFPARC